MELPQRINEFVLSHIIHERTPAFIKTDKEGMLVEWGGSFEEYGIMEMKVGDNAGDKIFFLSGLVPIDESEPLFLFCIQTEGGRSADIYGFAGEEFDWILLLDATKEEKQRQQIQQKAYDIELLHEKQLKLDEEKSKMLEEVERKNKELLDKVNLIQKQQRALRELSSPIIEVWEEVIVLPVIGIVDSKRGEEMMEDLLRSVVEMQSTYVIIDLTGVDIIDTKVADYFIKMAQAIKLIGANCILTGIRPEIAITMTSIGIDLRGLTTLRNLKEGLKKAIYLMSIEET